MKLFGFGKSKGVDFGRFAPVIQHINDLENEVRDLSDADLAEASHRLKDSIRSEIQDDTSADADLAKYLPRAFALVRETAHRTLGQRHYDVQLMAGIALHERAVVEMKTGEGKTLASTLPIYLNALLEKGVHVVTVNEYLAKRDAVWMGQIYYRLGLSVACLIHDGAFLYDPHFSIPKGHAEGMIDAERDVTGSFRVQENFLKPISRKDAYQADITYGTNHEFGFDYLRDNLAYTRETQVQPQHLPFAIIDEVDSILIDEARTPLIISAPDSESSEYYKTFAKLVSRFQAETHYLVDEKLRSVDITEAGIDIVEKALGVDNLYSPEHLRLTHYLQESLRAKALYLRDREYVVHSGEIIIIDQNTGRMMHGRRYSGGLHQAIEAKEGVFVRQESRTFAKISIQNYFRLYAKLAGMTGTAQTSAEEFDKVYGLHVVTIPTNRETIRNDMPDVIFKTEDAKYNAMIEDIKARQEKGQPVLVGTISIEHNEEFSRRLKQVGIQHELLNAKNNEQEGAVIAQAGRLHAVTVATNMAGRGVDIVLGGNPPDPLASETIKELGGLHVIGTERHDSRRTDNQLRGRAGRQGDQGSTQFYLSLEDHLMRVFGGDRLKNIMERLRVPDDMPIQAGILNKTIEQAQSKVEGMNFDARKHLLEYDDVLNNQRLAMYRKRQEFLEEGMPTLVLQAFDALWMSHLENMDALAESVRLRAYGQKDPLIEYRREGYLAFQNLQQDFDAWMKKNEDSIKKASEQSLSVNQPEITIQTNEAQFAPGGPSKKPITATKEPGRNDP
ncbi:MAG: preprotein translocase subunit SecA, partial [Candidatus Harrisonbacteria bacterium CG10_big_fil_rev_8_21_14_0_10_42_17]